MWERIKGWFRKSYGVDMLGKHMYTVILVLLVINLFLRNNVLNVITTILLVIFMFRSLSHNIVQRSREGNRYYKFVYDLKQKFNLLKKNVKDKEYKYLLCPNCNKQMRVPKKRGKIEVTCPRCRHRFDTKS